jgi:hypothetical protein
MNVNFDNKTYSFHVAPGAPAAAATAGDSSSGSGSSSNGG